MYVLSAVIVQSVLQMLSSNEKPLAGPNSNTNTSLQCYIRIHYFADELLCEAVPRTRRPTKLRAKHKVTSHESLPASMVYNSQ